MHCPVPDYLAALDHPVDGLGICVDERVIADAHPNTGLRPSVYGGRQFRLSAAPHRIGPGRQCRRSRQVSKRRSRRIIGSGANCHYFVRPMTFIISPISALSFFMKAANSSALPHSRSKPRSVMNFLKPSLL